MGIASFSRSPLLSVLLAPLHALAARWVPAQPPRATPVCSPVAAFRRRPAHAPIATKNIASSDHHTRAAGHKPCHLQPRVGAPQRLRVVRELEAGISPSCAGRMVISGRMADVCAELDRMTQREATQAA